MHPKRTVPAALILFAAVLIIYSTFALSANLAHAAGASDIAADRAALIRATFGQDRIPSTLPAVTVGIPRGHLSSVPNVQRIDRLRHRMPGGFTSTMYLIHPRRPNDRLLVFHTGHNDDFTSTHYNYRENLRYFVEQGYTILAVAQPLSGMNKPPAWMKNADGTHNAMAGLSRPLRPFLAPIAVGLNYALKHNNYESVSMTGLSGGGWTTAMYSAMDTRIESSYPVAGSIPLQYRTNKRDRGDFEQEGLPIYRTISYEDIYAMGAAGRRQLAIYNLNDECCFAGYTFRKFLPAVRSAVRSAGGGSYSVWLDTKTSTLHEISDAAEQLIDRDIQRH